MKIIVANLKMNLLMSATKEYMAKVAKLSLKNKLLICPTDLYLAPLLDYNHLLCAQNCFYKALGSYTGEHSACQLTELGITYSLVHHSERVTYGHEMLEEANLKTKHLLANNITPIICLGETSLEYNSQATKEALISQLKVLLSGIDDFANLIIAYEPIYAIGTNITPKMSEIEEAILIIKNFILEKYDRQVPVLYGGSVNEDNYQEILNIGCVDGLIIGSYITNFDNLKKICTYLEV